jgi:hypothetical protein
LRSILCREHVWGYHLQALAGSLVGDVHPRLPCIQTSTECTLFHGRSYEYNVFD